MNNPTSYDELSFRLRVRLLRVPGKLACNIDYRGVVRIESIVHKGSLLHSSTIRLEALMRIAMRRCRGAIFIQLLEQTTFTSHIDRLNSIGYAQFADGL